MIRLFVALPFPAPVRARLGFLQGGVPGARWTTVENFHLTLRFIGEVDRGFADGIDAALASVRAPAFELNLAGLDQFGHGAKPRVLYLGVERNPALSFLQAKVESALVRAGVAPETRRFSPHVTLARLKEAPPSRVGTFIRDHEPCRIGPIACDRFVLFSSWPQSSGPIYRAEVDYPLGLGAQDLAYEADEEDDQDWPGIERG